jgi:GT2 family glycosyltransferase
VVPNGDLNEVIAAAAEGTPRIALVRADRRPSPGWLEAAFGTLQRADVAVGPDHEPLNVAIDLTAVPRVELFPGSAQDVDGLLERARAVGASTQVSSGMVVEPAEPTPHRSTSLPSRPAPSRTSPRADGLITVVLCTKDRPDQLKRCLDSLALLDDDDHEIVIVDNNATPVVHVDAGPARARVVHEPRRGLDIARNRGIAEARGTFVAFIDDDCEADPHWLTGLRRAFSDPEVGLVTGRVRPASLLEPSARCFESYFSFDRGTARERFTPWDHRPSYPFWTGALGTGCNMAMRRDLFDEVGCFDEHLDMGSTVGGGGDLDIFARFLDHGVIAEYTPDALVWHHHRERMSDLARQFRGYGQAVGALVVKAVLDRPRQRRRALIFYAQWLNGRALFARQVRRGDHFVPMRLLVADLVGGLTGPFRYAAARLGRRR